MPDRRRSARLLRRFAVFGPALIVVVTGSLSLWSTRGVVATRTLVIHARDVLAVSSRLMTSPLEAETAQRGYILTRDTAFLDGPYRHAPARADSLLTELRRLTRDNPGQQARIDSLTQSSHARLAMIDSILMVAQRGRVDSADRMIAAGPGQMLTTNVRRLIDSLEATEQRLLEVREDRENASTRFTRLVLLVGTLIAGMLAFMVNRNMDRALVERRKALDNAAAANTQLEAQAEAAQSAALEAEQANEQAQAA